MQDDPLLYTLSAGFSDDDDDEDEDDEDTNQRQSHPQQQKHQQHVQGLEDEEDNREHQQRHERIAAPEPCAAIAADSNNDVFVEIRQLGEDLAALAVNTTSAAVAARKSDTEKSCAKTDAGLSDPSKTPTSGE